METATLLDMFFKIATMAIGVFIAMFASLLKRTVNGVSDKITKIEVDTNAVKDGLARSEREMIESVNSIKVSLATIVERNTAERERMIQLETRVSSLEQKVK